MKFKLCSILLALGFFNRCVAQDDLAKPQVDFFRPTTSWVRGSTGSALHIDEEEPENVEITDTLQLKSNEIGKKLLLTSRCRDDQHPMGLATSQEVSPPFELPVSALVNGQLLKQQNKLNCSVEAKFYNDHGSSLKLKAFKIETRVEFAHLHLQVSKNRGGSPTHSFDANELDEFRLFRDPVVAAKPILARCDGESRELKIKDDLTSPTLRELMSLLFGEHKWPSLINHRSFVRCRFSVETDQAFWGLSQEIIIQKPVTELQVEPMLNFKNYSVLRFPEMLSDEPLMGLLITNTSTLDLDVRLERPSGLKPIFEYWGTWKTGKGIRSAAENQKRFLFTQLNQKNFPPQARTVNADGGLAQQNQMIHSNPETIEVALRPLSKTLIFWPQRFLGVLQEKQKEDRFWHPPQSWLIKAHLGSSKTVGLSVKIRQADAYLFLKDLSAQELPNATWCLTDAIGPQRCQ